MSGKSPIPIVINPDNNLNRFAAAVKQNLDGIMGQQKNATSLKPLASNATLSDVIARLNAMLDRMQ